MGVGLVDYNTMVSIGDAIRLKLETTNTYAPYEMADAIKSIQNEGGGGSGFGNEYVIAALPFTMQSSNAFVPYVMNNYIVNVAITNVIPDDALWNVECSWHGMSIGNVYAFINDWNPERIWPPDSGYYYNYPFTFGLCLEGGNENSKYSILDMDSLFSYTYNIKKPLDSGEHCISMFNTYYGCYNLVGPPVCGPSVVQFANAYVYCYNLEGPPVCGQSVTNMDYSYSDCHNMTGTPVIGPNVISAAYAYNNCQNLIGDGLCPDSIINAYSMYSNCVNLTGTGYLGANCINSQYMYLNTGISKAVVNDGVIRIEATFSNCKNIKSAELSDTIEIINNGFINCISLETINGCNNLIVGNYAFASTKNLDSFICPDTLLCGQSMFWAWYSSTYNSQTGGYDITNSYATHSENARPLATDNLLNMDSMYGSQFYITGEPVCGINTRSMRGTYSGCQNLTGNPVFPENIGKGLDDLPWTYETMPYAYEVVGWNQSSWSPNSNICLGTYIDCMNLNGSPVIPKYVNNMVNTYMNCYNLTGNPIFSENLVNVIGLYRKCNSLTGSANMGRQVVQLSYCFYGADNVSSVYLPNEQYAIPYTNAQNAFSRINGYDTRLNIVCANYGTWTAFKQQGTRICNSSLIDGSGTDIPYVEIEGENISVARYAYNTEHNIYLYCTV